MCVSLCVFLSFTASPAPTVGPMTLIFCMSTGSGSKRPIFCESRSKVKGQGPKSGKMCLFEPFFSKVSQHWSGRDGWVLLATCQFFLAACQNL